MGCPTRSLEIPNDSLPFERFLSALDGLPGARPRADAPHAAADDHAVGTCLAR